MDSAATALARSPYASARGLTTRQVDAIIGGVDRVGDGGRENSRPAWISHVEVHTGRLFS